MERSGESSERLATQSEIQPSLIRAIGVWALTASIINITVGGGIFRLPSAMASMLGAAAPIAYVVCAIAMGLIVLCFAEAGSRVSRTGGPYAYVELVFGPFAGFLGGVMLWLAGTLASSLVATVVAANIAAAIPTLGNRGGTLLLLVVIVGTLTWVNVRGIRQGTWVVNGVSVAKLLPLVLLLVLGLPSVRSANVAIPALPSAGSVARASTFLLFAFAGIEAALIPSGEVRNPSRTVPRAIALAMIGITLLNLAVQIVAQGILGPALADPANASTPLAAAAGVALGGWGRQMLIAGAAISMLGNVSGMVLTMPRLLFAFAEDRILPRQLASVHPRYRTPAVAIVVQSIVVVLLAITSTFERLLVMANLAALLLYLGCIAAAWELRRRGIRADEGKTPMRLPFGPLVHVLAAATIIFMLTSITPIEWVMVAIVLAAAAVIFFISRIGGGRAAHAPAAEPTA